MSTEQPTSLDVFEELESEVRSYIRSFPAVFTKARGPYVWDAADRRYLDFFSGAGALNYGHNNPALKARLLEHLQSDGITHSLDMATEAKARFLRRFHETILQPRGLEYRIMFPGPTGTNAVESALKLVRKATGHHTVIAFTDGFHGMTTGALAVSGNRRKRRGAGLPLAHATVMPYDGFLGDDADTIAYLERFLDAPGSGVDTPAGVIVETVQGEGGLRAAGMRWLRRLAAVCRDHAIPLIVDDIQAGCGRTGPFFSFEPAGITPDVVCLSKSISGYGLPMALTLIRPDLDVWEPGEHNGTFRGNNPAFVTGTAALEEFWLDDGLTRAVQRKAQMVRARLVEMADRFSPHVIDLRGRGLIQGLACADPGFAAAVTAEAFARGLILETSGAAGHVVKLLPPLTIDDRALHAGLDILAESLAAAVPAGVEHAEAGVRQ